MRRPVSTLLMVFVVLAAATLGLAVGRSGAPLPEWLSGILPAAAKQSSALSDR